MIKSVTMGLCILALGVTPGFAQTSPMNANAMMKKHHIRKHDRSKPGLPGGNLPGSNSSDAKTEGMRNGIGMAR